MKNLLLTAAFVSSSISLAFAQEISLGPTFGMNHAWISDAPGDTRGLVGFNAGLTLVYSTEEHWGLGLDLKYSGEGVVTEQRGLTAKTQLQYVRVPLKIYHFFNDFGDDFRPKIYIGPSMGFLVGGKTEQFLEAGTVKVDSKDLYEAFDVGLLLGTGFNYRLAERVWFNFDVAYAHGLTDVVKTGKGFNRNLNLNVGIAWGL